MVRMGEDRYAVPLNTIKGILRIDQDKLEHYYTHPDDTFEYADDAYQLV